MAEIGSSGEGFRRVLFRTRSSCPKGTMKLGNGSQAHLGAAHLGAAHDPVDGTVLWSTPWPGGNPNVAQPLPLGDDRLLVSSGYGIGSKLYRITRDNTETFAVEELWESRRMKAKFTNLVYYEGNVYGLDDGVMPSSIQPWRARSSKS